MGSHREVLASGWWLTRVRCTSAVLLSKAVLRNLALLEMHVMEIAVGAHRAGAVPVGLHTLAGAAALPASAAAAARPELAPLAPPSQAVMRGAASGVSPLPAVAFLSWVAGVMVSLGSAEHRTPFEQCRKAGSGAHTAGSQTSCLRHAGPVVGGRWAPPGAGDPSSPFLRLPTGCQCAAVLAPLAAAAAAFKSSVV